MSELRKDHSVGTAAGATGGVLAGAAIGGAVGGPVGAVVGGIVGAIGGSKAGDSIAEAVNPTEYQSHWEQNYTTRPYYSKDYSWNDYSPAYKLGYDGYAANRGKSFDSVERDLQTNWNETRGNSRLEWNDAKLAVKDGWNRVERALPGDADGDGR